MHPVFVAQCVSLVRTLRLSYGTLDFVEDVYSQLHFLEINPMGQFVSLSDGLQADGVLDRMARLIAQC